MASIMLETFRRLFFIQRSIDNTNNPNKPMVDPPGAHKTQEKNLRNLRNLWIL
jgi:hypothetical protein